MKRYFLLLLMLFIFSSLTMAVSKIDLGLNLGGMAPDSDALTQQTFGKDFYWQGVLGLMDESGWEVRANLGSYADISHNPADLGTNLRINVRPLTASLLYHFSTAALIEPYLGGGVGGYFYSVEDDIYGNLESGFKFGYHMLGGIKFNIADNFYVNLEYSKHFIPPIFFNNANNFNSSVLTLGMGFDIPLNNRQSAGNSHYRYTSHEEDLLVQIQQLTKEIQEMKNKRDQLEEQIDDFYDNNELDESSKEFVKEYRKIRHLESKVKDLDRQISDAQNDLSNLQQEWRNEHADNVPVEERIVYLQRNYAYSPYGLHIWHGYFIHNDGPYRYRYYNNPSPVIINNPAPPTIEEKKQYVEKKKERLNDLKNRKAR
ncbi:MAG: outer membrane beta-barrel protein [Candidatus Margulisbacteria bacterium]|nr:outer membrane beta-barrel protein [Candidatus Margulisiibacteriota bacterium]